MGKLSIGLTLSRIEAKPGEAFQGFELFTMQELSKETGNYDLEVHPQFIKVSEKRLKQLTLAMQGSIIRALSVQMLRELKIEVPPLALQQKLGSIYRLKSQRQKLITEKQKLEEKVMNHLMIQYLKEEI